MSTKIIHVIKNDNFDDVFDSFKETDASEVIFIFPKNSRFSKNGQYFQAIKDEADTSGKRVSIITADPIIADFALDNGIELLKSEHSNKKQSFPKPAQTEEESEYEESSYKEPGFHQNEPVNEEPEAELAAARGGGQYKILKDIVRPEEERPLKVRQEKHSPFEVDIKKDFQEDDDKEDSLARVWASKAHSTISKKIPDLKKLSSSGTFKKTPFFFTVGALLVLLSILFLTLGKAEVIIHPVKKPLDFQIKTSVSTTATEINLNFNRIPGQLLSYKDEASDTFPATGQKEAVQKASGKIIIYNKSGDAQRLVATTRFKSSSGLIFRIPETINVPAASKGIEGKVESTVYADKAGSEYNIGPTTFTIPGFEGTPKATDFYAKSTEAMNGGIIGPSKVVTQSDFIKASEALTSKLKDKILQSLKKQAGDLKILESASVSFDFPVTNAKVDDAAENLKMTVKGSASTLAFRESDILELIKNYITGEGELELLTKNLTIRYLNVQLSPDNTTMNFDIQVTGQAANKIAEDKILKDIAGMNENAIRSYFKGKKEVESVKIGFSPFWVSSVPKDPQKIKIIINND